MVGSGKAVGSGIVLGSGIRAVARLGYEFDDFGSILCITNSDVDEHVVDGSVIFDDFSFTVDFSVLLDFDK